MEEPLPEPLPEELPSDPAVVVEGPLDVARVVLLPAPPAAVGYGAVELPLPTPGTEVATTIGAVVGADAAGAEVAGPATDADEAGPATDAAELTAGAASDTLETMAELAAGADGYAAGAD